MQEQLTSPSTRKMSDATLYGGRLSITKFFCAIIVLLIALAIVFAWNGGYSGSREPLTANELLSGMPLP